MNEREECFGGSIGGAIVGIIIGAVIIIIGLASLFGIDVGEVIGEFFANPETGRMAGGIVVLIIGLIIVLSIIVKQRRT